MTQQPDRNHAAEPSERIRDHAFYPVMGAAAPNNTGPGSRCFTCGQRVGIHTRVTFAVKEYLERAAP